MAAVGDRGRAMAAEAVVPTAEADGRRFRVPATRDPFINTPLLSLSPGADGSRRYWISTYNSATGCLGVLVDERGRTRTYRFGRPHSGFYSAVQTDDDTLWLCGDLSRMVRLTLSSGEVEVHPTGADEGLVFRGMAFDAPTQKLYAAALGSGSRSSLAFDIERRAATIYHSITPDHYTKASFPNGDGTHTLIVCTPGLSLLRWNPDTDYVSVATLERAGSAELTWADYSRLDRLISDDHGRRYFPGWGWYDPALARIVDGPVPETQMTWIGRIGSTAWGVESDGNVATIARWDLQTGSVTPVCRVPDLVPDAVALTDDGMIAVVSVYGEFARYDGWSGALELTRRFDADAPGLIYHVRRISDDRLLGAPFITQRFWELRLSDGEGADLGRAAPGVGEVKLSWLLGGKVYFAAYVGGSLTEYTPDQPARFPENPRVVADTPEAMRPTAGADDGARLWFACSRDYGKTGCTLTRYDTRTGIATYVDDPATGLAIRSLVWDAARGSLIAGTSIDGDNLSAERVRDGAAILRVDPETLEVIDRRDLAAGANEVSVVGPIDEVSYLAVVQLDDSARRWFSLSTADLRIPALDDLMALPEASRELYPTARPGIFARRIGTRIDLWDLQEDRSLGVVADDESIDRFFVQDDSLYLVTPAELVVIDGLVNGGTDV